ncbi:anaerobic ribonucleoside-triphosphate reductase [Aeromonas phage avDM6]|nr:anaerobic ribonucleoside-triphosphate reductase [Aeromonas phage avDM6]
MVSNTHLYNEVCDIVDDKNDSLSKENANKDSKVIPTKRDMLASAISKEYAGKFISQDILSAHYSGIIHFHDLGYSPLLPMTNCCLVNVSDMLKNGFVMSSAHITQPTNVQTASNIISQILINVSNHQYGGTTVGDLDVVLAPYVKMSYDKLISEARYFKIPDVESYANIKIRKMVYDSIQTLEYQLNSLTTGQGQTPFTTVTFGIGSSPEAKLVQEMILRVRIDGLGEDKETAVFPKLVFTLKDGLNLNPWDPHYDIKQLALECSSKRIYPDIMSYDQVVKVTGSYKSPMGCRSFLGRWENEAGEEIHDGRQNLGVITLNLPRIALDCGGDKQNFMALLTERMEIVRNGLMQRIERFRGIKASVAPILYMHGAMARLNADDDIMQLFENGRASVSCGYIGLHEVCQIIKFDDESHIFENSEKQEFALAVLRKMKSIVDVWTEDTGFSFSLYATPSESLCERFCNIDSKLYNNPVHEKGYYQNSFHLDVEYNCDPYEKIDFERQFIKYSTGGFISYGEFPDVKNNLKALEDVWDYAYKTTPYYGSNIPVDKCLVCGYNGETVPTSKGYECPSCGNHDQKKLHVRRRVCGYIGALDVRPFNDGKHNESIRRVKHL